MRKTLVIFLLTVSIISKPLPSLAISDREALARRICYPYEQCFIVCDDGTVFMDAATKEEYPEVSGWTDVIAISAYSHGAVAGLRKNGTVLCAGANLCDEERQRVANWTHIVQVFVTGYTIYGVDETGVLHSAAEKVSAWQENIQWENVRSVGGKLYTYVITQDGHVLTDAPVNLEELEHVIQIADSTVDVSFLLEDGSIVEYALDIAYWYPQIWDQAVQITYDDNQFAALSAAGTIQSSEISHYHDAALENIVAISGGVAVDREGNLHFTREIETDEEIPVFNLEGYHFD